MLNSPVAEIDAAVGDGNGAGGQRTRSHADGTDVTRLLPSAELPTLARLLPADARRDGCRRGSADGAPAGTPGPSPDQTDNQHASTRNRTPKHR